METLTSLSGNFFSSLWATARALELSHAASLCGPVEESAMVYERRRAGSFCAASMSGGAVFLFVLFFVLLLPLRVLLFLLSAHCLRLSSVKSESPLSAIRNAGRTRGGGVAGVVEFDYEATHQLKAFEFERDQLPLTMS